jgi:hypothetical protein
MRVKNKEITQALLCLILATVSGLTTHIYVSEWIKPMLDSMTQEINSSPDSSTYPPVIIYAAYGTAFITVALKVFLYYHAQHLLPIKSKILKTFLVAALMLEINGNLIRQPVMDILLNYTIGMKNPFLFVALNNVDKWLANILLAACLIYLCPQKTRVF